MKKAHGAELGGRGNQHTVNPQVGELPTTAQRLAAEHGVSKNTVERAEKFADEVEREPELKAASSWAAVPGAEKRANGLERNPG